MLWNFIGGIGRHGMQQTALPEAREPKLVEGSELANASPAFDAWLQAYRERLEEFRQRADLRPASAANANG